MTRTRGLCVAFALVFATAAGAQPFSRPLPPPPGSDPGMPAPEFIRAAAQGDAFEREAGRIASTRASDPRIREFAQMMMREHTRTTIDMQRAIRSEGRLPPPSPPFRPDQVAMLDQLHGASGRGFDWIYLDQQIRAHETALQLMTSYAHIGRDPALRDAAQMTAPLVRQHLQMARTLRRGLGR